MREVAPSVLAKLRLVTTTYVNHYAFFAGSPLDNALKFASHHLDV